MTQQAPLNFGTWQPDLEPYKTFRIAVSGDVILTRTETRIVDTRQFQRLRTLRQLGLCYLVYPSAQHSRFEHMLGSLKKAEAIMRMVTDNSKRDGQPGAISPQQTQMVRLAALLHDIGNVPLGHTLEDETKVLAGHQEGPERLRSFLGPDTEIGRILLESLGQDASVALLTVLTTKDQDTASLGENAFICDIVKNTVCADLLDYLERDAYFCNLNVGIGERFLRYLFIQQTSDGARRLAVRLWKERDDRPRDDIVSELIQLLQARYYLAERVYFHHTKLITSAMIGRAVWAAMNPSKGHKLSENSLFQMGDDQLLDALEQSQAALSQRIAAMLRKRALYKRAYRLPRPVAEADKKQGRFNHIKQAYHLDVVNRVKTEDEIADLSGLESGDILIYCPDPDMNMKAANMLVTWAGEVKPLRLVEEPLVRDRIANVLDSHKNLWAVSVYIHPDKATERNVRKVAQLCREHFERESPYSPEIIEQLLLDVAAEDGSVVNAAGIKQQAEQLLSDARGKPTSLSRKYLRERLARLSKGTESERK